MNIRKIIAGAATALLVGSGVALVTALPASAHTYGVTATCEDGLTVNLTNYHPTIPGKDAIPGTDPIPGQHHDAVGEPTITVDNPDYVPAQDAVPTTYVQEWLYVQHQNGKTSWHEEGWNGIQHGVDTGKGWAYVTPEQHRDSDTVLVQGHDAIPAQGTPTIEIPNPDYVAAYDDPETPGTPGEDAVPEQHNHVTIIRDGEQLVSSDFGPTFQENYPTPDKTVGHTYTVTVTSLDGIGAFTQDLSTEACVVVPPEPIVLTINPVTHTEATCDAGVTYTVPEQDEHIKYALNGDTRPTPGTYSLGAGESVTISAHLKAQYLGEYAPVDYSVTITGADKKDCTVVTPPVVTPPAPPAPPAAPAAPVAPAQLLVAQPVTDDVLAQTGSNDLVRNIVLGVGAVILTLIGTAGVLVARRPGVRRQG